MLFYKTTIHWNAAEEATIGDTSGSECQAASFREKRNTARSRSKALSEAVNRQTTFCFMSEYEPERGTATVIFATEKKENAVSILHAIQETVMGNATDADLQWQETTIQDIMKQYRKAERKDYVEDTADPIWNMLDDHFSFRRNLFSEAGVRETIQKQSVYGCREVLHQARNFFAGDLFREEVERIYSDKNPKKFYGVPVHYDFCFSDTHSAGKVISLLAQALLDNNRLLGRRISTVSFYKIDFEDDDNWDALETIMKLAYGSMLVIDFTDRDNSAKPHRRPKFLNARDDSETEETFKRFFRLMEKYQQTTLFVLLENPQQKIMLTYTADCTGISFLQFTEQINDRATALQYLSHLLEESNVNTFVPRDWETILTEQKQYTAEDVTNDFNFWYSHALQDHVYTAYQGCLHKTAKPKETIDHYAKLQRMVGLTEIKRVIDTILADFQMKKLRQDAGLKTESRSLHMLFTGNPGSAKTTCARLLAGILKDRGLLAGGKFVECGRSDLVGQYVGWTAKIVKEKFRNARGGVLFIDEAYALNSNDKFGPEAINTIVQEMENHRDDVIVIFAGYPEPMEAFLKANEGLRSRIAFHLHFPDYNADELTEIFVLMLKEQGFTCSTDFMEKARSLFSEAVTHAEFGNGRFARNLLEQSIMKQSARLIRLSEDAGGSAHPLHRKDLITLEADDLAEESVTNYRVEKPAIGFR